jgi:hypothetical protein
MPKLFDQKLFDENDSIAKTAVSKYLKNNFDVCVFWGYEYFIDLLVVSSIKSIALIEVDRRSNWVDKFPFDTVHVPFRKKKYFVDTLYPTYLFSVRFDCKEALFCDGETIINSPVVTKPNKYSSGEPFFAVPLEHWTLIQLC